MNDAGARIADQAFVIGHRNFGDTRSDFAQLHPQGSRMWNAFDELTRQYFFSLVGHRLTLMIVLTYRPASAAFATPGTQPIDPVCGSD
jgi:hypothetical protein